MSGLPKLRVTFDDGQSLVVEATQGDLSRFEQAENKSMANVDFGIYAMARIAHFALLRLKRKGRVPQDVASDFDAFQDDIVTIEPLDDDPKASSAPAVSPG